MTLADKIVALHRALARRHIPHAFGGAIALAYATRDPRGTSDIDLNVFVPATNPARGLAALPDGIERPAGTAEAIARDGQVRVWWEGTPIDLFFDYAPIHAAAARDRRTVPFAGAEIPIVGPIQLAVFKAMFDRTRDWADLEEMAAARALDLDAVRSALAEMVGPDDPRVSRVGDAARRGALLAGEPDR